MQMSHVKLETLVTLDCITHSQTKRNGHQWKSMDFHGIPSKSMRLKCNIFDYVLPGSKKRPQNPVWGLNHELPWIFMNIHGLSRSISAGLAQRRLHSDLANRDKRDLIGKYTIDHQILSNLGGGPVPFKDTSYVCAPNRLSEPIIYS